MLNLKKIKKMKNSMKRAAQVILAAVVLFCVYAGYLFVMTGEWKSMEAFTSSLFEEDLKNAPTVTVKSVSGGSLSWCRKVELSNGQTVYFHRDTNPSAWGLEKGDKIAVYISPDEIKKEKSAYFCGAFEKR